MKSLFKTVALITIFTIATRVLGFVFRIILSRVVGAETLGLYQIASSIFMVLLTIIASGIPFVISRMNAGFFAEKKEQTAKSFMTTVLIFTLSLSLIISILVVLFKGVFSTMFTSKEGVKILIALLPSLAFSAVYCVFRGDLWGRGNYFALCASELYEQVMRIVLSLLVINSSFSAIMNAIKLSWAMSVACFFSMILVIAMYFYYGGRLARPRYKLLKPFLKQSSPITIMRVAGSFVQPLVAIIIPARLITIGYTSSQALSLYGIAMGMTMPLLFIPTTIIGSLSTALVPDISTALAKNNKNIVSKRIVFSVNFTLAVSALFVPMFLGMGEGIGLFLYGNIISGSLLQAASWVLIPLGLTSITSSLLNSMGLENKAFFSFVAGAIIMFIAIWFLPSIIGINALVVGMGLNYLVSFLLNLKLLKKYTHVDLNIGKLIVKFAAVIIPTGALTSFVTSLSQYIFPLFIALIIGSAVAVTSFILLSMTFNIIDLKAIYFIIKGKFKLKGKKV